jgi:hypothetical protein
MIEHPEKVEGPVVDFFLIDETFPTGRRHFESQRLSVELRQKSLQCYIQPCEGEAGVRKKLGEILRESTVLEILSLSRQEVTIDGYWLRYYHLRFLPVPGYWIV